jgi:hypothetical protein
MAATDKMRVALGVKRVAAWNKYREQPATNPRNKDGTLLRCRGIVQGESRIDLPDDRVKDKGEVLCAEGDYRSSISKFAKESREYGQDKQFLNDWHIVYREDGPHHEKITSVQYVGHGEMLGAVTEPVKIRTREYAPRPESPFKKLRTGKPFEVVVRKEKRNGV